MENKKYEIYSHCCQDVWPFPYFLISYLKNWESVIIVRIITEFLTDRRECPENNFDKDGFINIPLEFIQNRSLFLLKKIVKILRELKRKKLIDFYPLSSEIIKLKFDFDKYFAFRNLD